MNKFIQRLFGFFRNNTFERLKTAVENDNIQKAYKILSTKTVDVNQKIYDEIEPLPHESGKHVIETCLLQKAKSDPMQRLLQHFGALGIMELYTIWSNEEHEKKHQELRKEEEERKRKEKQLKLKTETNNQFLNSVLR